MGCDTKTLTRKRTIYSDDDDAGNTNTFIPFFRGKTSEFADYKQHILLEGSSENLQYRRAARTSDDAQTWGTPTQLGAAYSSTEDAWNYVAAWTNSSTTERWFELGVVAQNSSGSKFNQACVTMIIELRGK